MTDSLDEPRERLQQYINGQALLLEITQRIAAGGSLGAMLPDITNATLRGSHADGVRIVLDSPATALTYATGAAAGQMLKFDRLIEQVVADNGLTAVPDLSVEQGAFVPLVDALGAVIALPLVAQGVTYGVLWLGYNQPRTFESGELTFLTIVAGQTAVAIANAYAFESARRGREQLAAILTSSADPVIVVDDQDVVVLLNPAAERALEVAAGDAIGQPVGDVINAEPLTQLLRGETDSSETVEWQNEAGHTFAPMLSDMRNDSGQRTGRVLVLRDITRYKELQDSQMLFVSTVSHDLRSPLTFMRGYADMLSMVGTLNEKQQGFSEKISLGIVQMSDLVEKILDAGRLAPEGRYELERTTVDVARIVNDIASTHQQAAEKKNLTLTAHVNSGLPILNLDRTMVQRAINNLVDNAIKYTPNGGTITVAADIQENNLVLRVQDTGLGISPDNQKHLFERFRRVRRKEHQAVKGSGLGLFIVKSVAQRHGGDAWVESTEGQGSTFFIRIPLEGANLIGAETRKA
ncbi:MAG: PAS domain-containing protein [Anaerolineae bacterium]|nr:PAS domain-containing protein [Anaerolineae bacterium]